LTAKDSELTDTPAGRVREITSAVAEHVRSLRTARGWSLDELAGRSGVSKGMLVQIEGVRTNPSVGTLARVADAFGVTVARLLEPPAAEHAVHIVAAEDAPLLWQGAGGGLGRLLRGMNEPDFVELWEWRFAPGERHDSADHAPGTRELLHVLSGELTVTVAGTDHRVAAGHTIDFRADRWHAYRNDGDALVRLLMVAVMPPGEWDRRRS
jgi:transcriptional regulator with XRE-family HTH domain